MVLDYNMHPKKEIKIKPDIHRQALYHLAYIQIEYKNYDDAERLLNQALLENPLDLHSLFEVCDIYKRKGELDKCSDIIKLCFSYSYTPEDISRVYRDMGFLFIEKKDYDAAIACHIMAK